LSRLDLRLEVHRSAIFECSAPNRQSLEQPELVKERRIDYRGHHHVFTPQPELAFEDVGDMDGRQGSELLVLTQRRLMV
jgi:hypothetical protein